VSPSGDGELAEPDETDADGAGGVPPGAAPKGVELHRSLAARISLLVLVMLLVAGTSSLVMIIQLRDLQASFDRLTEVYVVFNQRLAEAHVQSVRVYSEVRTHQKQPGEVVDEAFLGTFELALSARSEGVASAREPIDQALAEPERFGDRQLEALRGIAEALDELQQLVEDDEASDPGRVLVDVSTQNRIDQLFKSLAVQSKGAVEELGEEVVQARQKTETRTLMLMAAVAVLGALATGGLFLTLRPLRQLTARVRDLGRGDWRQRVNIPGIGRGDEVSQLAQEFNEMAAALEERERRLLRGERLAAAGQLAAQITHEIRNPLSAVALNVELLEDEIAEATPEAQHLLRVITREVDRLTAVTEDYLRFARRPKAELARIDLVEELRSMVEFMRPEWEAAKVEVRTELPDEPVYVMGDRGQLRQAFMNLVRNAQEAVLDDERGEAGDPLVEVAMECKEGRVVVVVRDNGPGIPLAPEQMDRIFEAFYTRKARGTGLGLPTVQQIAADHGGSVRVAETSEAGTTFEFVIAQAGEAP
jgi:two-component system NtrC family sensor kinase